MPCTGGGGPPDVHRLNREVARMQQQIDALRERSAPADARQETEMLWDIVRQQAVVIKTKTDEVDDLTRMLCGVMRGRSNSFRDNLFEEVEGLEAWWHAHAKLDDAYRALEQFDDEELDSFLDMVKMRRLLASAPPEAP